MTETILFFVFGGVFLVIGAELLVRGASRLALGIGVSPLVVGLTVVAFGTSAPELAVSVGAGLSGQGDVALGNVVGSNIFNILLILGLSALVTPLAVSLRLIRREVPLMIGVSILTLLLALDGSIGRVEGILLFVGIIVYTVVLIRQSRREERDSSEGDSGVPTPLWVNLLQIVGGLVGLLIGAEWLVNAASSIAEALGMSRLVIGLTVVAAGTSLPELATSVLASIRGERDIAIGNIVGSNIFNVLAVLGATGMISPDPIDVPRGALTFDIPVMIAVSVATLPVIFRNLRISRWEGLAFILYYIFYVVHLILTALDHDLLDEFTYGMIWFVLPLTVLTMGVMIVQGMGQRNGSSAS